MKTCTNCGVSWEHFYIDERVTYRRVKWNNNTKVLEVRRDRVVLEESSAVCSACGSKVAVTIKWT